MCEHRWGRRYGQQLTRLTQLQVVRSQRLHLSWQSLSDEHPVHLSGEPEEDEGGEGAGFTKRRPSQLLVDSSSRVSEAIEHEVTVDSSFPQPLPKVPLPL